jgi:chemotaxis protein histidine kinase CheA
LSADKKKAPHFEIYLAIEFAGGLVTDTNRSAVSCLFENNRLGNMLQRLIKSEQKSTDILELREYIDLTKLIQKTEKDIKVKAAKEAKEAKEAKAVSQAKEAKDAKEVSANNAAPNKDNLLQTELDKLPGVTADIQKKIVEKLNKEIPAVKELADTISKYNKEGAPYKPAYDKILTKAKSDVQSLIQNAKYDIDNNPYQTQDEKNNVTNNLLDYKKIKELIVQLIDQTFFEKDKERAKKFPEEKITPAVAPAPKVIKGGSYKTRRRRRQRRRYRKTRRI